MKAIYTLILPRLEVFYLQEWVEHHLNIGYDKIFIYNNGRISVDHTRGAKPWRALTDAEKKIQMV